MPNKYEREIEEILRNLEGSEPKAGLGQKIRRRPDTRIKTHQRRFPALNFKASEWLLFIAVVTALVAGGLAYAQEPGIITGALAIVSAACLLLLILMPFMFRSQRPFQSTRYGNVTPLHRNPLSSIQTRWHLFLLKLRYRNKRGR